jgi:hypothetical protein
MNKKSHVAHSFIFTFSVIYVSSVAVFSFAK